MKQISANLTDSVSPRRPAADAFTLVELLVVIAIIGILAGLLLPVLAHAKEKGRTIRCVSNLKQLAVAWMLWTDANNEQLPGNLRGPANTQGEGNADATWCAGYINGPGGSPDNDNTALLEKAQLFEFSRNVQIYKCPSDRTTLARSYSMNSYLGANRPRSAPVTRGYRQMTLSSHVDNVGPANIFVFIDERPEGINDGAFEVDMTGYSPSAPGEFSLRSYPGIYHGNGANLSFGDGHVETRRWLDPRTRPAGNRLGTQPSPDNADVGWLQEHSTRVDPSAQQ